MTFLYEVCKLIPENIKTKSLLKTNYYKMRVSLGSLWLTGHFFTLPVILTGHIFTTSRKKHKPQQTQNTRDRNVLPNQT